MRQYKFILIKEVTRQNFPFKKEFDIIYKSTKYLDIVTSYSPEKNLVFEFKVFYFPNPFSGKVVRKLFEDYNENTRFFLYLNHNDYECAILSIEIKSPDVCKILDIIVEPTFQNLGVGTELVKHVEKIARENSARVIVIECQTSNYPAIRFFQKNKFQITGFNLINKSRDDLKNHDFIIQMSKLLE